MATAYPEISRTIENCYGNFSPEMIEIMRLIESERYMHAKYKIAGINNLQINKSVIDFDGNENERFTRHLRFISTHHVSSECNSDYCPKKTTNSLENSWPSLASDEVLTKTAFEEIINVWLFDSSESSCHRNFNGNLPPNEYIYWADQLTEKDNER